MDNKLIHHHIGGGGQAAAVPATVHNGYGGIHNAVCLVWYKNLLLILRKDEIMKAKEFAEKWTGDRLITFDYGIMRELNLNEKDCEILSEYGLPFTLFEF